MQAGNPQSLWFCADLWVGVRTAGVLGGVSKVGGERGSRKGTLEKKNIIDKGWSEGSSSP